MEQKTNEIFVRLVSRGRSSAVETVPAVTLRTPQTEDLSVHKNKLLDLYDGRQVPRNTLPSDWSFVKMSALVSREVVWQSNGPESMLNQPAPASSWLVSRIIRL